MTIFTGIYKEYSNLQTLLVSLSPTVHSVKYTKKSSELVNGNVEVEVAGESFELMEFWKSYEKWSAYGASVPLVIASAEGETVEQYYSASLSAMQIYTTNQPSINNDNSPLISRDSGATSNNIFGHKYFEFNEIISPYERVPFNRKIDELAMDYPELLTYRSTDLSPYSWVAIAWYPIYQIPLLIKKDDLCASFLTYHTVSTNIPGISCDGRPHVILEEENVEMEKSRMTIPPFAATTYKMNGAIWINTETSDLEMINNHRLAAHTWLKMLNFSHHDYNFFSHSQQNNQQVG